MRKLEHGDKYLTLDLPIVVFRYIRHLNGKPSWKTSYVSQEKVSAWRLLVGGA